MQSDNNANSFSYQSSVKLRVTVNKKLCFFGFIFLPIFVLLGFWQIDRAEQKQQLQSEFERQQQLPLINFSSNATIQSYQRINFIGTFDRQHYWLLDNQVEHGRQGYRVIAVLYPEGVVDRAVLVEWLWIAAPSRREQLPIVNLPLGLQEFIGYVSYPGKNPFLHFNSESINGDWPQRIATIDGRVMESLLGHKLVEGIVKKGEPELIFNVDANKHRGYAVQWFVMAVVLLIALLFANSNLALWIKYVYKNNKLLRGYSS